MNDLGKKIIAERIFSVIFIGGIIMAAYSQWHQYYYPEKYSPSSVEDDYWASQGEQSQEFYAP